MIDLKQSRYLTVLANEAKAFTVMTGTLELYACSPEGSENFHKIFLAQIEEGETFFSPVEVLFPLEFQLFARSDCRIEERDAATFSASELAKRAGEWFYKLVDLPWIRYLAGVGDESVVKWQSRKVFVGDEKELPDEEIGPALSENMEILSMLITARFKKIEQNADIKMDLSRRHKDRAMAAAMQNLLKTEYQLAGGMATSPGDDEDSVRFAVCVAAAFLGMDTTHVTLPADVAAKMNSVNKMRRLIKKANMQVRLVALPKGWHKNDMGAILGYYGEENEIVALLPDKSNNYILVSEKHRIGLPVTEEVASRIKGDAFACYAGLPPKKLNRTEMFRFMFRHSGRHDWAMVWVMSLVAGLLPILMPLITESIFRDVIPINDRQALGTVAQVMLVSGFTTAIVGLVRSISFLRIKSHVGVAFESALWSRLLSLPVSFFRNYDAGNLVGRMQGVAKITELLGDNVLSGIFNMLFSFWSLVLMFYYNVKLTLISMAFWAVYLLINGFLSRGTVLAQRKMTEVSNRTSARTLQLLTGLSKFRLQGGEASAFHLWSQTFGEQWKWNLKSRWYSNYTSLINVMMPTVLSMLLFYMTMSIIEAEAGTGAVPSMDAAKFMGFQSAFSGFNATLVAFVPVVSTLFSTMPFIENIMPMMETEPEVTDDKIDVGELSGEITVENLHFAYSPDSPMVLKGVSLHVKAGESLALVGTSGSGKSTLVRVLLGFEKPTQGAISFDGQDLSTLNAASVRSQMGVVLQNGQIMAGDIYSNIVGSAPLSMDDAWEAAKMVGLDKDIENMPMGMNTMISEGAGNISGGQKQRILLARSIVNRPKIVILDEATSALDNTTQAIVTESMKSLKSTRIIVAHRLSTIKDVDRIYVLQDGLIIEEGTYDELMKMEGLFARLAKRQLE